MGVETVPQTPVEPQQGEQPIVRKTADGVRSFVESSYGNVKSYFPTSYSDRLEATVGKFEWAYQPILSKIDPLVDQADQLLESAQKHTQDRVITPVQERVITPVQERVITPVVETAQTRVITPVRDMSTKAVHQWTSVKGNVSKKAALQIESGLEQVKSFSANQLKSVIHIDLIEYSREVLDNAHNTAVPAFERFQQRLSQASLQVQDSVQSVREMIKVKTAASAAYTTAATNEFRAQLRQRLRVAILASRELSKVGRSFVASHNSLESVKAIPSESMRFLLESGHMFREKVIEGMAEEEDEVVRGVLGKINRLLVAVKDVSLGLLSEQLQRIEAEAQEKVQAEPEQEEEMSESVVSEVSEDDSESDESEDEE